MFNTVYYRYAVRRRSAFIKLVTDYRDVIFLKVLTGYSNNNKPVYCLIESARIDGSRITVWILDYSLRRS